MLRAAATALAVLMAGAGQSHAQTEPPTGVEGRWTRIFTEEFSTPILSSDTWTTCYWWEDRGCTNLGTNEMQWYLPWNVSVLDGALALTARDGDVAGINGRRFPYSSGMVTTGRHYEERDGLDRLSFTYGYVEVRARPPIGQGLWSAVWLLPSDHESKPEIDILEVLGHRPDVLEMHYHFDDESVGSETENPGMSDDWQVYGLEWAPEAIVWYLNGVEQWRYDDPATISSEPMYLLINLAVGGDWPGAPDETTSFPARFLVDYVRVWQRGD